MRKTYNSKTYDLERMEKVHNLTNNHECGSRVMQTKKARAYDIVVYGHYTHDVIIRGGKKDERLGGSPAYIAEVLNTLGIDYHIVSKVGKDFLYHDQLYTKPIISEKPTTVFHNIYSDHDRLQISPVACESILPEDVVPAKVAIVTGVIAEVLPETLREIRKQSDKVIVDVQSLIRKTDDKGHVYEIPVADTEYSDILKDVDFISTSEKEFKFVDYKRVSPVTILTQGENGCTVIEDDKSTVVSTNPLDGGEATGCGDMFIAGFAYALLKGRSLLECAQTANKTGALALREIGVPKLKKEDISEVLQDGRN